MKIRIITAIISIPLFLFIIYLAGLYLKIFLLILSIIGLYEYFKIINIDIPRITKIICYLMLAPVFIFETEIYYLILIFLFSIFFLIQNKKENFTTDISLITFGIIYTSIGFLYLYKIRTLKGFNFVLVMIITIWVCDTAAYIFGVRFGRHKLAPTISPNKSVEGAAAGFIFSILNVIFLKYCFLEFFNIKLKELILVGISVGIFGQIGDLFESKLKRVGNKKDSGSFLPGHGGILDRFDSMIFSSIIIYLIFS